MKKISILCITVMMSSMMLVTGVNADETVETCANGAGTVITGAITGYKYCRANKGMNWWNAYAWCDSLDKKMFTLADCKCSDTVSNCVGSDGKSVCPELTEVGNEWYVWTGTLNGTKDAHLVTPSLGIIGVAGSFQNSSPPPLCK